MRGYLQKYANVARGYSTRWFVLDSGFLHYYKSQAEEGKACRGSINLVRPFIPPEPTFADVSKKYATISTDQHRQRFTISDTAGSVGKYYLKCPLAVETERWVQALKLNAEFYKSLDVTSPALLSTAAFTNAISTASPSLASPSLSRIAHSFSAGANGSRLSFAPSLAQDPGRSSPGEPDDDDDLEAEEADRLKHAQDEERLKVLHSSMSAQASICQSLVEQIRASAAPVPEAPLASLSSAVKSLSGMIEENHTLASQREEWLQIRMSVHSLSKSPFLHLQKSERKSGRRSSGRTA